jgi:hypothetical protein
MKIIFILIVLQIMRNESAFCQGMDSSIVHVKSLGFDMLITVAISCDKFASFHHPSAKVRQIINKDSLAMLDSFLGKIKFKRRNNEIDVRAQMKYMRNDKTMVTICLDSNDAVVNGKLIKRNELFISFLMSMMP